MRTKKAGNTLAAVVDIWASVEEIEYEAAVSAVSLEGAATTAAAAAAVVVPVTRKNTTTPHAVWYYRDTAGTVQGPYPTEQMRQWVQAGFFPGHTPVSGSDPTGPWQALGEVQQLIRQKKPVEKESSAMAKTSSSSTVEDRIAALRREKENRGEASDDLTAVEDRIAALRQEVRDEQQQQTADRDLNLEAPNSVQSRMAASLPSSQQWREEEQQGSVYREDGEDSVQNRIAALRARSSSIVGQDDPAPEANSGDDDSVQDRIATMKAERLREQQQETDGTDGPTALVQNRIAALRSQRSTRAAADEADDEIKDPAVVAAGDSGRIGSAPPPPPPPPPRRAAGSEATLSYPLGDAHEVGPYPVDDGIAPYPVCDEEAPYPEVAGPYPFDETGDAYDVQYPIDDDEYPVTGDYDASDNYPYADENPVDGDYPVTDPYEAESEILEKREVEPLKKKLKIDKAYVAFLPSQLQKRKPATKVTASAKPKKPTSALDDYQRLMKEVDED